MTTIATQRPESARASAQRATKIAAPVIAVTRRSFDTWDVRSVRTQRGLGTIVGTNQAGFIVTIEGNAIGPFVDIGLAERFCHDGFARIDVGRVACAQPRSKHTKTNVIVLADVVAGRARS